MNRFNKNDVPLINSMIFRPYLDIAAIIGGAESVNRALADSNLRQKSLNDLPVFVPYKTQASIAEHLSRSTGLEHFGHFLSSQVPYQSLGPYADYVLAAEDLREAIHRGVDAFSCIIQGAPIYLEKNTNSVALCFNSQLGNTIGRSQVEEGFTATLINLVRLYTSPDWLPDSIRLTNVGNGRLSKLEQIFRTNVVKGEDSVGIEFPASILGNRIRDNRLKKDFVTRQDAESCVTVNVSSFRALICNCILLEMMEGDVSLETVSRRLGIGTRTLQRRLMLEGEIFQNCLDWIRNERARQLLTETRLSVDSISHHLGFAEPNSFRRAFRKWNDMSAQQYKHAARDGGARENQE